MRPERQAARERKIKRWEEDDFYDSDEDEFLDRTGTIAEKRFKRMKMAGKVEAAADTYETLVQKHKDLQVGRNL